jgi:hypothetical protein
MTKKPTIRRRRSANAAGNMSAHLGRFMLSSRAWYYSHLPSRIYPKRSFRTMAHQPSVLKM